MSDDSSSKGDGISGSVALVISILSLLTSAVTLYVQFLKGPRVRAYQPNVVYVSNTSIGIPVAFTNEGTSADVVVAGSLDLTPRPPALSEAIPLYWVSPFEEKESYDPNAEDPLKKFAKEKVEYTLFSHLPIKAGEDDAEIFWFDHRTDVGWLAGCYHACGRFGTARGRTVPASEGPVPKECSFSIDFSIAGSDLHLLTPQPNKPPMVDDVTIPAKPCS